MKPFLMIDVDGPLNPWAATNSKRPKMYRRYRIDQYVVWLAREHGRELNGLADVFDLVWCTTWEHQANTDIGPKIGLPKLPVIVFPNPHDRPNARLHWKTASIRVYVDGRPFAWVDDEVSRWDEQYLQDVHESPVMLRKIDPAVGLTDTDFVELREWAEGGMYDGQ